MAVTGQEIESQESDSFLQNESTDEYCKRVMDTIRQCQKHSNDLQGWQHYADFSGVQFTMRRINTLLHKLITKVFSHQDIKLDISGYKLDAQFEIIREGNDALVERINNDIDEANGIRRDIDVEMVDSTVRTIRGPLTERPGQEMVLLAPRNVQKPQLFFSPKIDNSASLPFIPTIKDKPNSLKPLAVMICLSQDGTEYYSHPYSYELSHWCVPEAQLPKRAPTAPLPLDETPLVYIDTEDALLAAVEELRVQKAIAVDLEHHAFRSYQGLACLIQISTRAKDYVIDPFPLRNKLAVLNEVFTHPKIVKVFHGADQDVCWLQRDCGVYVVNMFDTHQAAAVLEYPRRSLASLLLAFCGVQADKSYQRADWRIRPLPADFLSYARQDTHSLLYIFDMLTNELLDRGDAFSNLLHATYNRSTEICAKRYEKPVVGPESHVDLYRRSRKAFNGRQLGALQMLHLWRDRLARQQDESPDYILPRHMLLQMSAVLPKTPQGVLACCNPVPAAVKAEQVTLCNILKTAREREEAQLPSSNQPTAASPHAASGVPSALPGTTHAYSTYDPDLTRRHDLSEVEDDPAGLGTLLAPQETLLGTLFDAAPAVNVSAAARPALFACGGEVRVRRQRMAEETDGFSSPYERFTLYLAQGGGSAEEADAEREEEAERAARSDLARIQEIKLHFLSLSSSQDSGRDAEARAAEAEAEAEADADADVDAHRMRRLQDHISSLAVLIGRGRDDAVGAHKSRRRRDAKAKPLSLNEKREAEKSQKLKRKSSELAEPHDVTPKRVKTEEEEEEESSGDATDEEAEPGEIKEDDASEDEEEEEPLDYAKQNYDIFRSRQGGRGGAKSRRGRGQIRERFKGKRSGRGPCEKKSGSKSMNWGKK